jgi:hypothetical protein
MRDIFKNCSAPIPYWAKIKDRDERYNAIDKYCLAEYLSENLNNKPIGNKKMKI